MSLFDQKPGYASRPLEWLFTGGRAHRSTAERFLLQLIGQLSLQRHGSRAAAPILLANREGFRQLVSHEETISIVQRYLQYGSPLFRSLAVGLLSKNASRFNLLGIDGLCRDDSPMVRKHVAKALRRLEARELLKTMAEQNPDDRAVQWFATFTGNPKSYRERLENFTKHANSPSIGLADNRSQMPLWFRDEYWSGSPPKSVEFLREILQRIQSLVHGS